MIILWILDDSMSDLAAPRLPEPSDKPLADKPLELLARLILGFTASVPLRWLLIEGVGELARCTTAFTSNRWPKACSCRR